MSVQTFLLAIHILGCSFGVGASTILDLRVLALLSGRTISDQDLAVARLLSLFVRFGLLLLWLSGICFLARYWLTAPELLGNPKLHAKIAIVVTLTLNGFFIELFVMPLLNRQFRRALFDGLSLGAQSAALIAGAISATSWYAAFALGVLREWNFTVATSAVLAGYVSLVVAAGCVVILAAQIFYRPASDASNDASLEELASGSRAASPAGQGRYIQG